MAQYIQSNAMPLKVEIDRVAKEIDGEIREYGLGPWCRSIAEEFKFFEE